MALDRRLDWLQAKTCQAFGVEDSVFVELLQQPDASSLLNKFLDGGAFEQHCRMRPLYDGCGIPMQPPCIVLNPWRAAPQARIPPRRC